MTASGTEPNQPTESNNSNLDLPSFEEDQLKHIVPQAPEQFPANLSLEPSVDGSPSGTQHKHSKTNEVQDLTSKSWGPQGTTACSFLDLNRPAKLMNTGLSSASIMRSPSSVSSDSSEEIILFGGRGKNHSVSVVPPDSIIEQRDEITELHRLSRTPISQLKSSCSTMLPSSKPVTESRVLPQTSTSKYFFDESLAHIPNTNVAESTAARKQIGRSKVLQTQARKKYEDEILADYITNAIDSEKLDQPYPALRNQRILGGSDDELFLDGIELSESDFPEGLLERQTTGDWNETSLLDFDEISTSNDITNSISYVLSKRQRPSGLQYLVVWEGNTLDDARWISSSFLNEQSAIQKTRSLHEIKGIIKPYEENETNSNETFFSNQAALDLQEDKGGLLLEDQLLGSKRESMTDEQTARLLSKQEELGLGSNELVLYDGDDHTNVSDGKKSNIQLPLDLHTARGTFRTKTTKQIHERLNSPTTPVAIDSYTQFDIMDHDRPSLKIKSKGRKNITGYEVSDSELDEIMKLAWEQDRKKKGSRKQQREELRSQGLLGRKNKLDVKAKYGEGMNIAEVKVEIQNFLISTSEWWVSDESSESLLANNYSLSLPPMDKEDRKLVHYIANAFSLKSKSVGGGRSRFPVLQKTRRSQTYNESAIRNIEARMDQIFFPRMDKGSKSGRSTGRGAFKARKGGAAASYFDGEVVGATAPELGIENRGRAMLEKMGWSTGTALGAMNNKGIMQPLAHVVKTSKAGLGQG